MLDFFISGMESHFLWPELIVYQRVQVFFHAGKDLICQLDLILIVSYIFDSVVEELDFLFIEDINLLLYAIIG